MILRSLTILSLAIFLFLTGCASRPNLENAQYWQRKETSSALYLQGPKAQQMLHQDVAGCTNEISELQRVGALRRAIPANRADDGALARHDTPERDGYLRMEHSNYHDFETCMTAKGWERVEYLPYAQADRAQKNYLENVWGNIKGMGGGKNIVHSPVGQNTDITGSLND